MILLTITRIMFFILDNERRCGDAAAVSRNAILLHLQPIV